MPLSKEPLQKIVEREQAIFAQALLAIEYFRRNEPPNEFFWMPAVVAGSDGIAAILALQELRITTQDTSLSHEGVGPDDDSEDVLPEAENDKSEVICSSEYLNLLIQQYRQRFLSNFDMSLPTSVTRMTEELTALFDDNFDLELFEMIGWEEANRLYIELMYSNPMEALQFSYQVIRYCYKQGASQDFVKRVELWEQRLKLAFETYIKLQRNSFNRN